LSPCKTELFCCIKMTPSLAAAYNLHNVFSFFPVLVWATNERVSVLMESYRTLKTVEESFPSGVARDGNALFRPQFERIASRILLTIVNQQTVYQSTRNDIPEYVIISNANVRTSLSQHRGGFLDSK